MIINERVFLEDYLKVKKKRKEIDKFKKIP